MDASCLVSGLRRVAATAGGEYAGPCPWCGGSDRFRVWPSHPSGRPRWWCRRCQQSGDGIDLLRRLKGMSFQAAASTAGHGHDSSRCSGGRRCTETTLLPPGPTWQARAEAVACEAEAALWRPEGARARAYLRKRGFDDPTIREARLGYLATDGREPPERWGLPGQHRPVWLPQGIVIPWRSSAAIWRLNIRRPRGEPKYCGPAGSANGLYGADGLQHRRPVVIVEGELDALAVAQQAGDMVNAVATGSTHGARHARWLRLLAAADRVAVAFDDDEAGEHAAAWWLDRLPRARRLVPLGDPASMLQEAKDLHRWVERGIQ